MHIKFNGIGSCILMKLRNLNMLITSYDQYVVHFCIKWKFDRSIRNKWNADIFSRTLLVSVVVSVCATSKCIFIYRSRKMNRTVWQQHNNKKETSSNHKFIYKNDTVHTVFFRCYFICMAGWKKNRSMNSQYIVHIENARHTGMNGKIHREHMEKNDIYS